MNTLVYYGDPMCSWCYGIAPEIHKITEHFGEKLSLEIVMGGLRPYETKTMLSMKEFLKKHWLKIEQMTGQKFSFDILETDIPYDTEPSSRAVVVAKKMNPEIAWAFYEATHWSFYAENKDPVSSNTYYDLAKLFELDVATFQTLYQSEEMKQATRDEFASAKELGIAGFPTLVLKTKERLHLITRGYQKASALIDIMEQKIKLETTA